VLHRTPAVLIAVHFRAAEVLIRTNPHGRWSPSSALVTSRLLLIGVGEQGDDVLECGVGGFAPDQLDGGQ
jgi:hypothetical protein